VFPLCNIACSPFYSSRGACTRVLSPDMWAQEHNGCKTWGSNTWLLEQSSCALTLVVRVVLVCWGSFPSNAQVLVDIAYPTAWAYYSD
jgi:hypothetical protein